MIELHGKAERVIMQVVVAIENKELGVLVPRLLIAETLN